MHNTFKNVTDANLTSFLKHSKELEKTFGVDRYEFDKTWIQIKYHIASSASHIYSFLRTLIIATNMKSDDARYYFFYIDMILSGLSSTVFTETPKTSKLDILSRNANEIATIGENLLYIAKNYYTVANLTEEEKKRKESFDIHFQRLFIKVFTLYDFSYSGKDGIFTRFTLNKDLFQKNKDYFNPLYNSDTLPNDISLFLKHSLVYNISNTIKNNTDTSVPNHLETYKKFIEKNKITPLPVELFSYILSTKLWKFTKYLHDMPEYIELETKKEVIINFEEKIITYTKKNLDSIQEFYEKKITNKQFFQKVYEIDKEFMQETVFNNILVPYITTDNSTNSDDLPITLSDNSYWLKFDSEKHPTLSKLINYMIENNSDEKFKFYRIFEKGNFTEIALTVDYLYADVSKYVDEEKLKHSHFIGLLRSGSFLAHALTILNYYKLNSNYQTSSSILTYPYISLVPREIYDRKDKERHIIYIDEAVKSQYSLSIADTYRKRILHLHSSEQQAIKDREDAFALVNFKDYLEMTIDINPKIHSSINIDIVSDVKKSIISVGEKINKDLPKEVFNWKTFLNDLDISDEKILIKTIYDISLSEDKTRLDFTKVIKHSDLLFKIAKFFAIKLNELSTTYQTIVFFHGCSEAKILSDTISFVYKSLIDEPSNLKLDPRQVSPELLTDATTLRLFIDLTIDSKSTREETKLYYLTERLDPENNVDFQETFVIASRDEDKEITYLTLFNQEVS